MTKEAHSMIAAGLADAIAFAGGDTGRARVATPVDVRAIRAATGRTQAQFAEMYHLPVGTVRDWEQQRRQPDAPARVLLGLIASDPEGIARLVARSE